MLIFTHPGSRGQKAPDPRSADPDPHQSVKLDPDRHQSEKQDLICIKVIRQKATLPRAVKGRNGAMETHP